MTTPITLIGWASFSFLIGYLLVYAFLYSEHGLALLAAWSNGRDMIWRDGLLYSIVRGLPWARL